MIGLSHERLDELRTVEYPKLRPSEARWLLAEVERLQKNSVELPGGDLYFKPYCPCCGMYPDQVRAFNGGDQA